MPSLPWRGAPGARVWPPGYPPTRPHLACHHSPLRPRGANRGGSRLTASVAARSAPPRGGGAPGWRRARQGAARYRPPLIPGDQGHLWARAHAPPPARPAADHTLVGPTTHHGPQRPAPTPTPGAPPAQVRWLPSRPRPPRPPPHPEEPASLPRPHPGGRGWPRHSRRMCGVPRRATPRAAGVASSGGVAAQVTRCQRCLPPFSVDADHSLTTPFSQSPHPSESHLSPQPGTPCPLTTPPLPFLCPGTPSMPTTGARGNTVPVALDTCLLPRRHNTAVLPHTH